MEHWWNDNNKVNENTLSGPLCPPHIPHTMKTKPKTLCGDTGN